MPKDPKKNIDRYKVRGGNINEFEFDQNQEALAQQESKNEVNLIPGTPPEEKAHDAGPAVAQVNTKKTTAKKAAGATRGASAKQLAALKAARKNSCV